MSAPKQDVRFLVSVKRHDSCFVVEATPIRMMEDDRVRNITDSFRPDPLADLMVRAQGNPDEVETTYGWEVEYRSPFSVDRERAEVMVRRSGRSSAG